MWQKLKKLIKERSSFILTTHINPDGDGIGSACALLELLLEVGKKVRFVSPDPIPPRFFFLDKHNLFEEYSKQNNYSETDVLIVLDAHKKERIGRVQELTNLPNITTVVIDHHPESVSMGDINLIDEKACSVGAMLYTFFKVCGITINLNAAQGLYTSVICDSGRFCYSSTSRKAHKIADECLKVGVDPSFMYSQLFQQVPKKSMDLFTSLIQYMEYHLNNQVVIQEIPCATYSSFDSEYTDYDFIHEFHKLTATTECVVLLLELPSKQVRVSMRSKYKLDVGALLKKEGGGGHCKAAGALWDCSLVKAKEKVLSLLEKAFNTLPHVSYFQ